MDQDGSENLRTDIDIPRLIEVTILGLQRNDFENLNIFEVGIRQKWNNTSVDESRDKGKCHDGCDLFRDSVVTDSLHQILDELFQDEVDNLN